MFARFRNLFSKNKTETELETENGTSEVESSVINSSSKNEVNATSEEEGSKLEGFSLLKSLVETEQNNLNNKMGVGSTTEKDNSGDIGSNSLSNEVSEMLKEKLFNFNEFLKAKDDLNGAGEELNGSCNNDNQSHAEGNENKSKELLVSSLETTTEPIDSLNTDEEKINLVQSVIEDNSEYSKSENDLSESLHRNQENQIETKSENGHEVSNANSTLNTETINNDVQEITSDQSKTDDTKALESNEEASEYLSVSTNKNNPHNNIETIDQSLEISNATSEDNKDSYNDDKEILSEQKVADEAIELSESICENNVTNNESSSENAVKTSETQTSVEISEKDSNLESQITANENNSVNDDIKKVLEQSDSSNEISITSKKSHENSPELSESSHSSSLISVKENNANSSTYYPSTDSESNIYTNSSIVVEDLPSEVNTPSPATVDSTISGSSSSTLDSSILAESSDPTKIVVNPINSNILACHAITSKLTDIAEVAESLDTVIRNIQENSQAAEVESNPSPSDKKLDTLRSASSEDWHSRSTEDDSFATASEGNFTPHSHSSSSFQTASGRTSSYVSCDKNSFDASEADDSTYAFEMPELTSPLNMSFEGSEQSYISAQHPEVDQKSQDQEHTPTKLSESGSQTFNKFEEDQGSIADIDELHSESVTPTPQDNQEYHVDSIPIESETELEVAGIADAPSMEILTETMAMPMSRTPEVSSPSTSAACANQQVLNSSDATATAATSDEQNTNKPNAAWRRSKYYENITKQTIKGFL